MSRNNFQNSSVKKPIEILYYTKNWSDCKFCVGTSKTIFPAHKIILASASEVFEKMFYGSIPEDCKKVIVVDDITDYAFNEMLKYIYSVRIEYNTLDHVGNILHAADKYMIQTLKDDCIQILIKNVTSNPFMALDIGNRFDIQNIVNAALEVIRNYPNETFMQNGVLDISFSTLLIILDMKPTIISDILLFKFVLQYAFRNGLIAYTNEKKIQIINNCIREAVCKIRFSAMSINDFNSVVDECRSLLMDNEIIAIYKKITSKPLKTSQPREFDASENQKCEIRNDKIIKTIDMNRTSPKFIPILEIGSTKF